MYHVSVSAVVSNCIDYADGRLCCCSAGVIVVLFLIGPRPLFGIACAQQQRSAPAALLFVRDLV
jgi:hypothetical protein